MAASTARTTLTADDRWAIGLARELASLDGDAVRARALAATGSGEDAGYYVLGEAQPVLARLAGLAERLAAE